MTLSNLSNQISIYSVPEYNFSVTRLIMTTLVGALCCESWLFRVAAAENGI